MKIVLQMMAQLMLNANVDGIQIRQSIVIYSQEMMNGLMWDLSLMIISKQREKTVILMLDGNNALREHFIINGCAQG